MKATFLWCCWLLSCGIVYCAVQGGCNFPVCGWNPMVWPFKWKLLRAVLSWGTVYYVVQGGSHFWVCGWNPMVWPQIKATEQYFPVVVVITLYKVILTFESVNEILWCDHSNESYWAVLYCGTVYYAVQGGSHFWVCGWKPVMWPFKHKLLSSTFAGYHLL